jgi:RNA polymerase sigma-70 factor (ECF subfamily)
VKKFMLRILRKEFAILTSVSNENLTHITDQELLDHFYADGDNEWLGILLQRYTLLLLGVCMNYLKNEEEAKDSVQQIFLKALLELHKYKVTYFKSWIYMVTRNYCLMKLRDRQGKIPAALTEKMAVAWDEDLTKTNLLEKDNLLDRMGAALEELNKDQKLCVTLFYLQKKSYQEIAETTLLSLMQVKSHIQNGKRNLRLLMEKKENNAK